MNAPNYMFEAKEKPTLEVFEVPLVEASEESVKGYGCLVDDPDGFEIEIVRWPARGWRPIDDGTGDEGGWVEGVFHGEWKGDVLYGSNEAVGGNYVLGWSTDPQSASSERQTVSRDRVLALAHELPPRWRAAVLSARQQAFRRAGGAARR